MDYKQAARSHEINKKEGSIASVINKSTIASFEVGYEFCKKEYEEKLRWIPISEELPDPLSQNKIVVKLSKIDTRYGLNNPYTEIRFASVNCHRQFVLSLMNNYEAKYITAWRYFL